MARFSFLFRQFSSCGTFFYLFQRLDRSLLSLGLKFHLSPLFTSLHPYAKYTMNFRVPEERGVALSGFEIEAIEEFASPGSSFEHVEEHVYRDICAVPGHRHDCLSSTLSSLAPPALSRGGDSFFDPEFGDSSEVWSSPAGEKLFSGSKSADTQSIAQLPAVPSFLERTYFTLGSGAFLNASELLSQLQSLLTSNSVACEATPALYKLSCTSYVRASLIKFVIRLYSSHEGNIVVEWQRRAGCSLAYCALFRNVQNCLSEGASSVGMMDTVKAALCPLPLHPPAAIATGASGALNADISTPAENDEAAVTAVEALIESHCADTQKDGAEYLAALADAGVVCMLEHKHVTATLTAMINSNDTTGSEATGCTKLAAVSTLAQLCSEYEQLAPQQQQLLVNNMSTLMAAIANKRCTHLQREASRAVNNLVKSGSAEVVAAVIQCSGMIDTLLEKSWSSPDSSCRTYAENALSVIADYQMCTV
jgi:hypothetical protein